MYPAAICPNEELRRFVIMATPYMRRRSLVDDFWDDDWDTFDAQKGKRPNRALKTTIKETPVEERVGRELSVQNLKHVLTAGGRYKFALYFTGESLPTPATCTKKTSSKRSYDQIKASELNARAKKPIQRLKLEKNRS